MTTLTINEMTLSDNNHVSPPEDVPERWQTKINSLPDGIRYIYENEVFCDVEFLVSGKKFKGHRIILVARSPKFAKMLLEPGAPRAIEDDSSKIGFEILWRYIYTDELGTTNQSEILEAYRVANKFEQKELVEKCEELINNMDLLIENVCTILNQVPDVPLLRERCLQFIRHNNADVVTSSDFLNTTPDTLKEIFKHKCLEDLPLTVLQHNILRWGFNQFPALKDYKLVRDQLYGMNILGKLKIQKLSMPELTTFIIEYPQFLTAEEFQQFILHEKIPANPIPSWCEE